MSARLTERQLMKKLAQEEAEKAKAKLEAARQDFGKGSVEEKGYSPKHLSLEERKRMARVDAKSHSKEQPDKVKTNTKVESDEENEAEFKERPKTNQEGQQHTKNEPSNNEPTGNVAMSALSRFQRPGKERKAKKKRLILEESDEEEPAEEMKIKKKTKKESNDETKSIQRRTNPPSDVPSASTDLSKSVKHDSIPTGSGSSPKPSSLIASMMPGSSSTASSSGQPVSSLISNMIPASSTGFSASKTSNWRGDSSGNRRRPNPSRVTNRPQGDNVKSEPGSATPVLIESLAPLGSGGRSQNQILSETATSKPAEYKPSETESKTFKLLQAVLSVIVSQEQIKLSNEQGPLDPAGSFICDEESKYAFFDTNEKGEIVVQPSIPIFPEEFPPGMTERPLSWWGIVDPNVNPDDKPEHLRRHEEWKAELYKGKSTAYPDSAPTQDAYGTNEQSSYPKKESATDSRQQEQSSNWKRKDAERPQFSQNGPSQDGRPPQVGNWDRDRNQRPPHFQNGNPSRPPQANDWDRRGEERPPYPQGDSRHPPSDNWDRDRQPFPQRRQPDPGFGPGEKAPPFGRGAGGRGGRNSWEDRRSALKEGRDERIPR